MAETKCGDCDYSLPNNEVWQEFMDRHLQETGHQLQNQPGHTGSQFVAPTSPISSPTSPIISPTGPISSPTGPISSPTSPISSPTGPIVSPISPMSSPTGTSGHQLQNQPAPIVSGNPIASPDGPSPQIFVQPPSTQYAGCTINNTTYHTYPNDINVGNLTNDMTGQGTQNGIANPSNNGNRANLPSCQNGENSKQRGNPSNDLNGENPQSNTSRENLSDDINRENPQNAIITENPQHSENRENLPNSGDNPPNVINGENFAYPDGIVAICTNHCIARKLLQKLLIFILQLFNFIFAITGLALLLLGLFDYRKLRSTDYMDLLGYEYLETLIAVICMGGLIILISIFGFIGTHKINFCMMLTYNNFLVFIIIVETVFSIIAFHMQGNLRTELNKDFKNSIEQFNENKEITTAWNNLQRNNTCCGIKGKHDWKATTFGKIPESCCSQKEKSCDELRAFSCGCLNVLQTQFLPYINVVCGIIIGIAFIPFTGLFLFCIANEHRRQLRVDYERLP